MQFVRSRTPRVAQESSVVDEPEDLPKAWLSRFEDNLDRMVGLLRELQSEADSATANDTAAHVRLRLDALAARLQLMERRRRRS